LGGAKRIRLRIKEDGAFHKDVRSGHARGAHLLREEAACYKSNSFDLGMAAAVEPGKEAPGGRKEVDGG
jgi:hypothetical protein